MSLRDGTIVAVYAAALASGCSTVIPLQTASTVAPGAYRVAAQATTTPYCSWSLTPVESCQSTPGAGFGGPAVVPELRLGGRYGVADGIDLGASVHTIPAPEGAFRGGFFVEGKYEALSSGSAEGEGRALLSAGLGGGVTTGLPTSTRPALTQVELALPVFLGLQRGGVEWVFSPRLIQRFAFADVDGDGRRDALPVTELGIAAGVFTRASPSLFVQLGYSAPLSALHQGPFTLAIGAALDLPAPRRTAPAEAEASEDAGRSAPAPRSVPRSESRGDGR